MRQVLESEWGFENSQDLKGADGEPNDMLRSVQIHCVHPQCQLSVLQLQLIVYLFHICENRYGTVPSFAQ